MDYHIFKSMLNRYYARYVGGEKRPVFFEPSSIYPELDLLTQNFALIQEEFANVYKNRPNLPLYHEIDPGEANISTTTDKDWKVFMLYLMGYKPKVNQRQCPQTSQLLEKIPNLMQAFFSILDPGKSIPPHEGPYLGYLRYHLALKVPTHNPPRLYVNSEEYIWREGEAVMFDDSWTHAVQNESNDYRVVLIVDVLRPMPFLPSFVNKIITGIIAKYTYGRSVINRIKGHSTNAPVIT